MTAQSTKGAKTTFEVESSYAVDPASSPKDVRVEGATALGNPFSQAVDPQTVFSDVYDREKPIKVDLPVDGAFTIKTGLTMAATPGQDSFAVDAFKSAGYSESSGDDTTLASYSSTSDFTLTVDNGAIGRGCIVELNDGSFYPVLIADYAAKVVTPAMALPSASGTGKVVNKAHTIYPGLHAEVATTLTLKYICNALSGTHKLVSRGVGCSAAGISDLTFRHGELPFFEFKFNAAKMDFTEQTGTTLGANDFQDSENKQVCDMPFLEFADADAAGGIVRETARFTEAVFKFGTTTDFIKAVGDASGAGGTQGHIVNVADDSSKFTMTLTMLWDKDRLDDWEGDNGSKHIAICQPSTSEDTPAYSIVMPNAHIVGQPEFMPHDETTIKIKVAYVGRPAGFSGTGEGDLGNQPVYILLGSKSS